MIAGLTRTVPIGDGPGHQELSWERRVNVEGLRREMQRISLYKRASWIRSVWWSARDRRDDTLSLAAVDLAAELNITWDV